MANINSVDVTQYVDLDYNGTIVSEGSTAQVKSIDAIKNVIKMYLFSAQGDYGRTIGKGGQLFDMIGAQLTPANQQVLESKIVAALANYNNIVINKISTSIDTQGKQFIVTILFSDTYNNLTTQINLGVPAS
jgi:phage baseplate assembly protein W